MHNIRVDEVLFQGAVSFENDGGQLTPWRLPVRKKPLFENTLIEQAAMPAGVRIGFHSTTTTVALSVLPAEDERIIDCVIDDALHESGIIAAGADRLIFAGLPPHEKRIELYLTQKAPVTITGLAVDAGATRSLLASDRPRWLTYGSSITQCKTAASPAETWPAIVSRRHKLNLTCLGYAANCHMEPMVARTLRDLPADFVSICLGINVMGGSSLSRRTFRPAVIGFIQTVRDKHPHIPFVVISPIWSPDRETTDNKVGLNLVIMRDQIADAVSRLQAMGDSALHYVNGLDLFNEADAAHLPDRLHPDAHGYRLMADRFSRIVFDELNIKPGAV